MHFEIRQKQSEFALEEREEQSDGEEVAKVLTKTDGEEGEVAKSVIREVPLQQDMTAEHISLSQQLILDVERLIITGEKMCKQEGT